MTSYVHTYDVKVKEEVLGKKRKTCEKGRRPIEQGKGV